MNTFTVIKSKMVPLPQNNVDTDQIIPARFLKVTDKASVADGLFADWRYATDGSPRPEFILNQPEYLGAQILVAGDNFGCGSSREHAPWALVGWGFRAVISTSFADIFKNNALKNGLLPVEVDKETHQQLFELVGGDSQSEVNINLKDQVVVFPDQSSINFEIDPFAKKCLLTGIDQLGYLLSFSERIVDYENGHSDVIVI